jgi:hypothetical protein
MERKVARAKGKLMDWVCLLIVIAFFAVTFLGLEAIERL